MNDRYPLLECTATNPDFIAEAAAEAYGRRSQSSAAKKAREHGKHAARCRKVMPVLLRSLETSVPYSPNPTPGEVLEAQSKLHDAVGMAFINPVTLWLLKELLAWLIPVLVRWWFSGRSQPRRAFASRSARGQ